MSVIVCGHKVRWHKPINVHTLIRMLVLLLALGSFFTSTTLAAAELPEHSQKASSGETASCLPQASCMKNAPIKQAVPVRTQRPAGPPSVSAMALVMALGMTSVSGPQERTHVKPAFTAGAPVSDVKALRLPADQFPVREQPRVALEQ